MHYWYIHQNWWFHQHFLLNYIYSYICACHEHYCSFCFIRRPYSKVSLIVEQYSDLTIICLLNRNVVFFFPVQFSPSEKNSSCQNILQSCHCKGVNLSSSESSDISLTGGSGWWDLTLGVKSLKKHVSRIKTRKTGSSMYRLWWMWSLEPQIMKFAETYQ